MRNPQIARLVQRSLGSARHRYQRASFEGAEHSNGRRFVRSYRPKLLGGWAPRADEIRTDRYDADVRGISVQCRANLTRGWRVPRGIPIPSRRGQGSKFRQDGWIGDGCSRAGPGGKNRHLRARNLAESRKRGGTARTASGAQQH
jgi:hypothetical protein